jgi:hypothetical protein
LSGFAGGSVCEGVCVEAIPRKTAGWMKQSVGKPVYGIVMAFKGSSGQVQGGRSVFVCRFVHTITAKLLRS